MEYNGKKRSFKITEGDKWVWNIDTANSYLRTTVKYSRNVEVYKEGTRHEEEKPAYKLISDEFFKPEVDFVFEVPEKLSVKKRAIGKNDLIKTVLYRLNDEVFSHQEVEAPAAQEELPPIELRPSKNKKK